MELEFDKEIDAILRRARGGEAVDTAAAGSHLDADTINAFVENALPARMKGLYTAHFADCGRCRKLLSNSISMNTAAVSAAGIAAEAVPTAAALTASIPWYSKLFRTPGLALGMGALVIVFSGVLGYLVLQNRNGNTPTVSQLKPQEIESARPAVSANSSAPADAAANAASNTMSNASVVPATTPANPRVPGGPNDTGSTAGSTSTTTDGIISDRTASTDQPMAAAPPPPPVTSAKTAEKEKDKDDASGAGVATESKTAAKKAEPRADEYRGRDMPMAAAKSGPSRSGPINIQSNQNATQQLGEMAVTRTVGGKTFNNRDGAWYDSSYNGQSTIDVRRGTAEFQKLDSSLRSIANKIGGVVVVVHGGKAYRIQ